MRVSVPPRRVAAQIKLDAVGRAGWGIAATALLIGLVTESALVIATGELHLLALPVLTIAATGAALGFLIAKPGWPTASAYLLLGAISIVVVVLVLAASGVPPYASIPHHLLIAIGLVGTVTGREGTAALWCLAGMVVGHGALLTTQVMLGQPPAVSDAALIFGISALALLFVQARTSKITQNMVPDLSIVDTEIRRHDEERRSTNRAAAFVHETILGDLALVAHGPPTLSADDRDRLRLNLAAVSEAAPSRGPGTIQLPRSDFYAIVRDYQWRGLTIDVGGSSYLLQLLTASAREALIGAMREALDNVLHHSGCDTAEIFIDQTDDRITVMIVDEGHGFDIDSVPDDRIGLRLAIMRRVEDAGGDVTVWSMTQAGTSVVISFPYEDDEFDDDGDDDAR